MAARTERHLGRRVALLPASALKPALATLRSEAPVSRDYVHEIKLDGYRIMARVQPGNVALYTRNGRVFSARAPSIAAALSDYAPSSAVLDGELVCLTERGASDFSALQKALRTGLAARLFYVVFDALYLEGRDIRGLDLLARKAALATWLKQLPQGSHVRYGDHLEGEGSAVLAGACALGLEGIVSKRASAPYRGGRVGDWLKIKCGARQELVIVGFTAPRGTRAALGALVLGYYEGKNLHYGGRVGTGFDTATLTRLRAQLLPLAQRTQPVVDTLTPLERSGVTWVRPELVAEVSFSEFTADGRVRHAVFRGLREDKRATEVVRERALNSPSASRAVEVVGTEHAHASTKVPPAKPRHRTARVAPAANRRTKPTEGSDLHGEAKKSSPQKRAKKRA